MTRKLHDITTVIVHCSDSPFGDVKLIDRWHKERGWRGCGYHFVITNGVVTAGKSYNPALDGLEQTGRPLLEVGAHCRGHNRKSVGVCLIGRHHFTGRQLYQALPRLLVKLSLLGITEIRGHCEYSAKTCPNINPDLIRHMANMALAYRKGR